MSYSPKFEDIEAWQLARELTRKVYGLTKKAKFVRDFGNPEPLNPEPLNPESLNVYKKDLWVYVSACYLC